MVSIIHLHHPRSQQHPSSTQLLEDTSKKRRGIPKLTHLQTEREGKLRHTTLQAYSQLGAHPHCTRPVLMGGEKSKIGCVGASEPKTEEKNTKKTNQPTDRPSAHGVGVPCGWGAQTPWVCTSHLQILDPYGAALILPGASWKANVGAPRAHNRGQFSEGQSGIKDGAQGITRSSWQIVRAVGEGTKPQPCAFDGFYGVINGGFTWGGFAKITPEAHMQATSIPRHQPAHPKAQPSAHAGSQHTAQAL